jgi:hypothetical protein
VAKLIIVIIVGLGAAFYFPDSRAMLLDRFSFAADPLMEWITVQEMRRVRGDLARWDDRRRAFPTNRDLPTWMRTHYQNDDTQYDAWGNPYWLVSNTRTFSVNSNGRDGIKGTEDDLSLSADRVEQRR